MSNIITAGNATNNGTSISSDTSGVLELKTGSTPTTAIAVDASQNVGIGTSSPTGKLDVVGDSVLRGSLGMTTAGYVYSYAGGTNGQVRSGVQFDGTNQQTLFFTGTNERMRIDSSGNLLFNSGYGSVATAYGCRAWVNFNGTGTIAIRASGNVSSITDNGVGDYTVNFTTAMPDANYTWVGTCDPTSAQTTDSAVKVIFGKASTSPSAGSFRCVTSSSGFGLEDYRSVFIAVFR